jgi:hypothetical protein
MVVCEKCGEFIMMGAGETTSFKENEIPESPVSVVAADPSPEEFVAEPLAEPMAEPMTQIDGLTQIQPTSEGVNFQDVIDFGNQDQPTLGFGALVYDLEIKGVDTPEIREDILSALTDTRLGLDGHGIIATIKNGTLLIPQLNPVKASIILSRLKYLPLEVSWTSQQLVKDPV